MNETVIDAVFIESAPSVGSIECCNETTTLGGLIAALEKLKSQYGEDYDPPVYLINDEGYTHTYGEITSLCAGTYIEGTGTIFDEPIPHRDLNGDYI